MVFSEHHGPPLANFDAQQTLGRMCRYKMVYACTVLSPCCFQCLLNQACSLGLVPAVKKMHEYLSLKHLPERSVLIILSSAELKNYHNRLGLENLPVGEASDYIRLVGLE